MLSNTIDYSIYINGDEVELTITLRSIAASVTKTGIACTTESSNCVDTCGIIAIVCISIALVYV